MFSKSLFLVNVSERERETEREEKLVCIFKGLLLAGTGNLNNNNDVIPLLKPDKNFMLYVVDEKGNNHIAVLALLKQGIGGGV